ncbi:MAG: hypothetical protein GDA36_00815 [Rhodobacteraceae bacterium]|nr:hypothetical protein [Paracoccaceae bacterium]
MVCGSVDLAILSGPLALPCLTSGKADPHSFCPIAVIASQVFCFGQPELSGGAASWHRHCATPQAAVAVQPAPAFSRARRGR